VQDPGSDLKRTIKRLARLGRRSGGAKQTVDIAPGCAFGAVVDQRLKDMERGLGELKGRVNGLIFVVAGAVLVEIVMRFIG